MSYYVYKLYLLVLQLNNLELAVNLAKRGNLPGAEQLVSLLLFYILILIDYQGTLFIQDSLEKSSVLERFFKITSEV